MTIKNKLIDKINIDLFMARILICAFYPSIVWAENEIIKKFD